MTIWNDKMVTILDSPLKAGDRVVLTKRYTIGGDTDAVWDAIAKPGAKGKVYEGPFGDGSIDIEWDEGTGRQKYSKIDADCVAREVGA